MNIRGGLMSKLKKQLQKEKIRLETILKTTEERLVDAPEGKLRIGSRYGTVLPPKERYIQHGKLYIQK